MTGLFAVLSGERGIETLFATPYILGVCVIMIYKYPELCPDDIVSVCTILTS